MQADGKILVARRFIGANSIGGTTRNRIARLDPTTGAADSFDPNASDQVLAMTVQPDGKILVAGFFTGANSIGGATRTNIARLDPVTGLADSFNPNADALVGSIAVQADGKILVGGFFTTLAPNGGAAVARNHIARLETDGRLDRTLNIFGSNGAINTTAVQPDGKILIGGNFDTILGAPRRSIARLNTDGTLDTGFNPDAFGFVYSIVVEADGKILAGGYFSSIGGANRNSIARFDPATGLADSFDPNADSQVESIVVQADGRILASGFFRTIGGQTNHPLARLSNETAALQNLSVTQTTITWTRSGSSPQLARVTLSIQPTNRTTLLWATARRPATPGP